MIIILCKWRQLLSAVIAPHNLLAGFRLLAFSTSYPYLLAESLMFVISDFYNTLVDFTTSVSVVEAPADWIEANSKHVLATIQSLGVSGEEYERFSQTILIYPVRDYIIITSEMALYR